MTATLPRWTRRSAAAHGTAVALLASLIGILHAVPTGWSAKATHPSARGWSCALYYGTAAPVAPAVVEGSVRCAQ